MAVVGQEQDVRSGEGDVPTHNELHWRGVVQMENAVRGGWKEVRLDEKEIE